MTVGNRVGNSVCSFKKVFLNSRPRGNPAWIGYTCQKGYETPLCGNSGSFISKQTKSVLGLGLLHAVSKGGDVLPLRGVVIGDRRRNAARVLFTNWLRLSVAKSSESSRFASSSAILRRASRAIWITSSAIRMTSLNLARIEGREHYVFVSICHKL